MDLKAMTEHELLQAYRGYKKWLQTKEIRPDDYDGYFWNLIEEKSSMAPHLIRLAIVIAGMELLGEIACRWSEEKMLDKGMDITGSTE